MASHRRGDGRPRPAPETARLPALLPQCGGDREQPAAVDRALCGLDAMAVFSLMGGLQFATAAATYCMPS